MYKNKLNQHNKEKSCKRAQARRGLHWWCCVLTSEPRMEVAMVALTCDIISFNSFWALVLEMGIEKWLKYSPCFAFIFIYLLFVGWFICFTKLLGLNLENLCLSWCAVTNVYAQYFCRISHFNLFCWLLRGDTFLCIA